MNAKSESESTESSSQEVGELVVRPKNVKATRMRKTRVKTGCITCRIRRIKCDETRPNCEKCTSTGRKCDGYPTLPMSRKDLPVAVHDRKTLLLSCHQVAGIGGFDSGTEMLYFDFFRSKTTPGTNHYLGSDFWGRLVLQLSHSEPAIKHIVLAISALHQQWDMYKTTVYVQDSSAVTLYGKGVHAATEMISRTKPGTDARKSEIERILVACILFVCFEYLIGDYGKAAMHLSNALQVVWQEGIALSARGPSSKLDASIVELLNRFDFQAMTFTQTQFPLRRAAVRFKQYPPTPLPDRFDSLTDIRSTLFEQVNWALAVGEVLALTRVGIPQDEEKPPEETFIEASSGLEAAENTLLHMWDLVEDFIERVCLPLDPNYRASATYAYLRVYHHTSLMLVMAGCAGYEDEWDICLPEFAENIRYLEELAASNMDKQQDKVDLSLEVGICVPLFMIASKCRDPTLRRRAIAILERTNRKEGIWESKATARVAERAMFVEESEARKLRAVTENKKPEDIKIATAADIPEEARAQVTVTHVNMAARCITMDFKLRSGSLENPVYRSRYEVVEF